MTAITDLTALEILSISENSPEKLFSGNEILVKSEYRALGRRWHPDRNPGNAEAVRVFQHISVLYKKALELIQKQTWRGVGLLELPDKDGSLRKISYLKCQPFELGDMYLAERHVVFAVEQKYCDLFINARRRIGGFRFADWEMQKEISRVLPQSPEYYSTGERLYLILPKPADMILLSDLLDFLGGAIDVRHVGWIQNCLLNVACYLEYAGLTHNDISTKTVLVSPKTHSAMLVGGWWYSVPSGDKLIALPPRTARLAPADVIRSKRAEGRTDLELIRATGRELLGDATGARLKSNKSIPSPVEQWLNGATAGNAILDYKLWKEVLQKSFGAPRFVRLEVEASAVYGQAV